MTKVASIVCLFGLIAVAASVRLHGMNKQWVETAWDKGDRVPHDHVVRIIFALKQRNLNVLEERLLEISDMDNSDYGQWLSNKEVHRLTSPTHEAVTAISAFLSTINLISEKWTEGKEFVTVRMTAQEAHRSMKLNFFHFRHKFSGRAIIRADSLPFLPASLGEHVELTLGIRDFFDSKEERRGLSRLLSIGDAVNTTNSTAPVIQTIYGASEDLNIYFSPVCANGSPSTSLCQDHPPPIKYFTVTVVPDNRSPIVRNVDAEEAQCSQTGSGTSCLVTVIVPSFFRCNVSVSTTYNDDSVSDIFYYPTRYSPTAYVTPQSVYKLYNIPPNTKGTHPKNSQAVVSFERQYISLTDLAKFFELMGLRKQTPTIHGPNVPEVPGGEATLDVQYVMGVGAEVNTTVWSYPEGDYILNWAEQIADTEDPPLVTSISYGDTEIGYEQKSGYGLQYIYRMNGELIKMASRGLTVIAGSGDAGWSNVGEMGNDLSNPDPTCTPDVFNSTPRSDVYSSSFYRCLTILELGRAFYPSVSPFVMSLSSTFIALNALPYCDQGQVAAFPGGGGAALFTAECTEPAEAVVSVSNGIGFTTGGGFSNVTSRYAYQNDAVTAFLKTSPVLPPANDFNASGQGYADISTLGWNQLVVWFDKLFPIGGTSASGPVAAGIFSLLNDIRLHQGKLLASYVLNSFQVGLWTCVHGPLTNNHFASKSPLGFINPALYKWHATHPDAFRDITAGNNNDGVIQPPGSSYPTFCPYGFQAQAGWDAPTGLGSPNFSVLSRLVQSLP